MKIAHHGARVIKTTDSAPIDDRDWGIEIVDGKPRVRFRDAAAAARFAVSQGSAPMTTAELEAAIEKQYGRTGGRA
jgi:hypothetical protein